MEKVPYEFFWRASSPFSQWHRCQFTNDGILFRSAEQFMMYYKAQLMGDVVRANMILQSSDPRDQKRIGRQIYNFDQELWDENKVGIVYAGNRLKFSQNPRLMKKLIATKGKMLVEASPYDKIWGIGLGLDDPDRFDPERWRGDNLLGQILTRIRIDEIGE
jgi:ribA/ribD-fused uncharacterized protein